MTENNRIKDEFYDVRIVRKSSVFGKNISKLSFKPYGPLYSLMQSQNSALQSLI